ncbi:hypothetical protein [Treponema berlinense]|uniref:hypothetical protein n=1 Tax=Treponema berlinense TaxID=225004 RepID=UPI003FD8588C
MKFNRLTEKEKATIGVYRNSELSCYLCGNQQSCGKKKAGFGMDRIWLINEHIDDNDFCQRAEAYVKATNPIADRIKQCFEPAESEKDFFEKQIDGWEPVPHFYNGRKDSFWDLVEK